MIYSKDENDLIYKLKKKLKEENNNEFNFKFKKEIKKNPLEFTYNDFINEFKSIEINNKLNNNKKIELNDINIFLPSDFSNINEFSELNLTKENLKFIKRKITTSYTDNNNECNIYSNNNLNGSNDEEEEQKPENDNDYILNTNEPFISDATNIEFKPDISKEESGFKSILLKK